MVAPGSPDDPAVNGMKTEITNDLAAVASDPHVMRTETAIGYRRGTKVMDLVGRTRRVEVTGRPVEDGLVETRGRITIRPKVIGRATRDPMATNHARNERRFPLGAMRLRG